MARWAIATLDLYLHERQFGSVQRDARTKYRGAIGWDTGYQGDAPILPESFGVIPGRSPDVELAPNFLGGRTPEGSQRKPLAAKRGIDPDDLYSIHGEFGGSIASAVTLRDPAEITTCRPDSDELSVCAVASRLQQAIDEHDPGTCDDSRSMLSGFQPKLLVTRLDNARLQPHGRARSTHIFKPQLQSRPETIFNEFCSHELARHSGLAQLQDHRLPSRKGRPSTRLIGKLLGSIPGGGGQAEDWLRQLVHHVAKGNNDAHAKNVALLRLGAGTQLTEIYDAAPNLFQEGRIDWNLALSVAGEFDHRRISAESLTAEALSCRVLPRARIPTVIDEMLGAIEAAVQATTPPALASDAIPERIQSNVSRLRSGGEISRPKKRDVVRCL
jgi:serine/threonine-protein kinase HipA